MGGILVLEPAMTASDWDTASWRDGARGSPSWATSLAWMMEKPLPDKVPNTFCDKEGSGDRFGSAYFMITLSAKGCDSWHS